jgi:hypothetical protein
MLDAPLLKIDLPLILGKLWRGMIRGGRARTMRGGMAIGVLGLAGCSWVSLGYNRLPELSHMWLDKQLHLEATHTEGLMQDLHALLRWHRQTQLPATADVLRRWQGLVDQPLEADEVCRQFDQVRGLIDPITTQAVPGMVRLARSLSHPQWTALATAQHKSNEAFRNTTATHTQSQERLDKLQTRYEMLYGSLTPAQTQALLQSIITSGFDPQLALTERQRRSQDLLQTLKAIAATPPPSRSQDNDPATAQVQAWLKRLRTSPNPEYVRQSRVWTQEACAQFATVHQLATPAQRRHARAVLVGYENDLRKLAASAP